MSKAVIVALAFLALSQPPAPSRGNSDQAKKQQPQTKRSDPAPPSNPIAPQPVTITGMPVVQVQGINPPQNPGNKRDQPLADWWPLTWNDTIMVALTFAIGVVASLQVVRMGAANAHTQAVERAYIGIHHRHSGDTDDSWDFSFYPTRKSKGLPDPNDGRTPYRLDIRVANSGQTPAQIHGGGVRAVPHLDRVGFNCPSLQEITEERGHIPGNFLHAGDRYRLKITLSLSPDEIQALQIGELWVSGFVEYSDTFRAKHRAGFCRRVNPEIKPKTRFNLQERAKIVTTWKNNLFVDRTCERYNYDQRIHS